MNREQKAAVIDEIAADIEASEAVYAVDYRGITVSQAAEIRSQLRGADTTFRIVKNSLTERAADKAGAEDLKVLLEGPTALAFVRGDAAAAAKVINDFTRATELAPFKGGVLNGEALDVDQIKSIARLPTRDVLYGQLVGMIASPITGLARGLNALLSGVAIALGQVQAKAEAGEITLGPDAPAAPAAEVVADEAGEAPVAEAASTETPEAEAEPAVADPAEDEPAAETPAAEIEASEDADATTSEPQEDNE
ncbi:MAG TPA: 50S ribosomal protein L10 [Solirubrobacteraceae bacterium]|nr:50S ribosomal protein L10 [Solirubrobacteraceae bacterium]